MTVSTSTTWRVADAISVCQPPSLSRGGYVLVDPGAFPDAGELASLYGRMCVPTNWGKDFTGLPMLIDLRQCDAGRIEWLESSLSDELDAQQRFPLIQPRVFAFLETLVSADAFAAHLAQQMLVLPIDRTGNRSGSGALWRFFDPRVFANLCWLLDTDQLTALTGPVSTWRFPWFGNWFELAMPVVRIAGVDSAERIAGFARIDIEVWERAQRIALVNQVLARLALSPALHWPQRASVANRIEAALAVAKNRLRWHQPDDQARYAEHVVRCGPAFLNHPKLAPYWTLREAQETPGSWADLAALLTIEESNILAQQAMNIVQTLPPAEFSNTAALEA
ncbi:hypothetical protein LMG24238_02429 [Paraburkholderia sediminicola]|uniref:Uncharacterized protein n=1 Tax=Paraburkholderia sediminicola TaxID=458836 RepID=A0A6J5ARE8_9BURK|nr:DUF4123 domain-containing protein [Paraburkholderia sediminicola]CAB3677269.1 hypothetical protein LMG24238_02429 [Paraburkholderia sediminicola]